MKADNNYYTSPEASDLLVESFLKFTTPKSILDPCAGDGALVEACKRKGLNVAHTYEIDELECILNGWKQADFLQLDPFKVDCVVCNPPFSEYRKKDNYLRQGKDLSVSFLLYASKFAPFLAFIMHQAKGTPTFDSKIKKYNPNMVLIHRECIPKSISKYKNNNKWNFVPTAIYIYHTNGGGGYKDIVPVYTKKYEIDDFILVKHNNMGTNMLVTKWGTLKKTGRLLSIDPDKILYEVSKIKSTYEIIGGSNFHLYCKDVQKVVENLKLMEPLLIKHFEYAQDCSNVTIRPEEFMGLYFDAVNK